MGFAYDSFELINTICGIQLVIYNCNKKRSDKKKRNRKVGK